MKVVYGKKELGMKYYFFVQNPVLKRKNIKEETKRKSESVRKCQNLVIQKIKREREREKEREIC